MRLVKLIYCISIFSLSYSNILSSSTFQLDTKDYSSIDSIVKYKQTYPKKALAFGFDLLKLFSKDDELTLEFVNLNYYIGETFYHLEDFVSSYEYLKKSLELYEFLEKNKRRNIRVLKPPWILSVMGAVYIKNGDYGLAESYYNEAIENFLLFDAEFEQEKIYGLSNAEESLALIEIQRGNFKNAESLFKQAKARKGDDIMFKMYSNLLLMELYILWNKLDYAEEYFNKIKFNYENKEEDKRPQLVIYYSEANLIYGTFFKDNLDYNKALKLLLTAKEELNKIDTDIITPYQRINYQIANILVETKKYFEAEQILTSSNINQNTTRTQKILNFKLLEKIYLITDQTEFLIKTKDSIITYNENTIQKEIQNEFNLLENLILVTDKQNQINIARTRTELILIISIVSLLSLTLLIHFLRKNFKLQKEKNRLLNKEKKILRNELGRKKRELFSKVNYITQRNKHISNLKEKLSNNKVDKPNLIELKNELKYLSSSNKIYAEFDKMFTEVYPDFHKKVNESFNLSKTDLRLASYIKMNHSNYEIARISGISIRTVESQRYRLSKKLNLEKGKDLNSFILNF